MLQVLRRAQKVTTRELKTQHLEKQEHLIELHLALCTRKAIVCRLEHLREEEDIVVVATLNVGVGPQEAQICIGFQLFGRGHFLCRLGVITGARVENRRATLIG